MRLQHSRTLKMVCNGPLGSRAGSQIPTAPVTREHLSPGAAIEKAGCTHTSNALVRRPPTQTLASVQTPTHVHTRSRAHVRTHTHPCTNGPVQGGPLTPQSPDLFLACLLSPAYPATAQVTQTWAPRLWAGQAGTCPKDCMETGGQRMQWAAWQRHRQSCLASSKLPALPDLAHRLEPWPIDTGPGLQPPKVPG